MRATAALLATAALAALLAVAIAAPPSRGLGPVELGAGLTWYPAPAGVQHHGELVCGGCDLRGWRNAQSGCPADCGRYRWNLDLGAGSDRAGQRGDVALNYDVGRRVLIYDGRKGRVAAFGPRGIRFYRRPRWPHRARAPR